MGDELEAMVLPVWQWLNFLGLAGFSACVLWAISRADDAIGPGTRQYTELAEAGLAAAQLFL